jgi:hypothetical protein
MTRRCSVSGVSPGRISDGLLQDDRAAVADLVDEMHRGARDLDAARQRRLVDRRPYIALAAERGDQRGVHVQNPRIAPTKSRRRSGWRETPPDHDQSALRTAAAPRAAFPSNSACWRSPSGRRRRGNRPPFARAQRVGAGLSETTRTISPFGNFRRRSRVDERLQVGAAAGDEHGDFRLQHSTTPSPETISPMR